MRRQEESALNEARIVRSQKAMTFDMSEWRHSILSSRKRHAVPLMTHPGIVLTNHSVLDAVTDARVQADAVRAVAQQYPTAAATMIMDLSVEAEAFGAKVRFTDDEVPSIVGRAVDSGESIDRLAVPDLNSGRAKHWIAAAREASQAITDRPLFAECIGPLSLAARLYDVTEMMTAIYIEPEAVLALIQKCTRFLISYILEFKAVGANGVVIAEPVAGMLSAEMCTEFSSNFVRQIVDSVQDNHFMVILHNCGETDPLVRSMLSTGAAGLHFGNKCNIIKALGELPPDTLVLGNIDPVGVFKSGTPDSVRTETLGLLEKASAHRNFIISSGCDVPPHVPLHNINAFFEALHDYNNRKT